MAFFKSNRISERQRGLDLFNELVQQKNKNKVIAIHYSCQALNNSQGQVPKIVAICVKNIGTNQAKSFSIHHWIERNGIDSNNLTDTDYAALEKQMLDDFYNYVRKHKEYCWLHWNMKDGAYGFSAIEQRYRILAGTKISYINDERIYDLTDILTLLYTINYASNKARTRLLDLIEYNGLSMDGILSGEMEAKYFTQKNFLLVHNSTVKKVNAIGSIFKKNEYNTLKVKSFIYKIYGISPPGIVEMVKNNLFLTLIWNLIVFATGVLLEDTVKTLFNNLFK